MLSSKGSPNAEGSGRRLSDVGADYLDDSVPSVLGADSVELPVGGVGSLPFSAAPVSVALLSVDSFWVVPLSPDSPDFDGGSVPVSLVDPPGVCCVWLPVNSMFLLPMTFTLTTHSTIQNAATPMVTRVNRSPALVPKAL